MRVRRLVHKADFERVLARRSVKRSAHFALYHVPAAPQLPLKAEHRPAEEKLSTCSGSERPLAVDKSSAPDAVRGLWLGCVVPKRHARRAVTRNLLKRQIRAAFARRLLALPQGMWLVRLRAPFSKQAFVSARSAALAAMVRSELDGLLGEISG